MKTLKTFTFLAISAFVLILTFNSCSKKSEPTATINVLASSNNKSGDVKGNGGSASKIFTFNNPGTTSGWDMSINSTSGSFHLILKDASGAIMLDKILTGGVGPQSADGTTSSGVSGDWTATIELLNFNGSGDYSFR